jgi:hypothetical protein
VLPSGWSIVTHAEELRQWNALHETTGVLLEEMLSHPRFTFLAHHSGGGLDGGAVLHDCHGEAVGLSNGWALPGTMLDVAALVACAGALHPGRGIVDYAWGDELDALVEAGFSRLAHKWSGAAEPLSRFLSRAARAAVYGRDRRTWD